MTSNGEVTNAELARRLDTFSRDVHHDITQLMSRMDSYVLREVYAADQRRREDQVNGIARQLNDERKLRETTVAAEKQAREQAQDRMRNTVRWLISALILPVGVLLVQIWMSTQGGG